MPFKIYTYEDPYQLDKTDFWDEISSLPHFCGARTLVNGLKDVLGDNIKGLICPLDELVEHEKIYKQWTDNISLRVQQYSALSSAFKQLLDKRQISKPFHMALSQNQNHFLEALRLFVELDIPASAIDGSKGNKEQKLFVYMLRRIQTSSLFQFPKTPSLDMVKEVIVSLANKEVEECTGTQKEVERCKRAVGITNQQPLNSIVVHGVHQFTPVQLRLLIALEKMGITVIFLFNYQKKYSKIYSSWNDIYSCFDVPIYHDTAVVEYQMPTMQNPSNALACALGELCEERYAVGSKVLREWNKLYKSIELREFANITEYAHFVSNHFDNAIKKYSESRSVMERGNNVWSNAGVLRHLTEQVYTANRDVHTLLKIYYPEYAKDRHFLSYPIGQFFSAIYRLWDYEKGQIAFDIAAIKECLSSNILNAAPGEVLLKTFYNTSVLFENITTYDEFNSEIADKYLENYKQVSSSPGTSDVSTLKNLSVYNKYKVPKKDVVALIKAIEEINAIATTLFALDNSHQDFIEFGKHFHNLEEFLKQRELALANEQERALIMALQLRLDKIKPEKSSFSGTFRDLKEGLHYYLKQKNDDAQSVDWIVKNYEQIDGDILQSKKQFEQEIHKVYHFACVSDRDMNMTVNDQLPWPLTDEFIRVAYSPVDLQFQVYYTALGERSNFLRYALFYGLCYNRCDVRLSFVRQYGEENTEPYFLLSLLGFKPKAELIEAVEQPVPFSISVAQSNIKNIRYKEYEMMDMFLCPYKYFLDYVMEDSPVVQGNFLYQKYFENIIIDVVWKKISTMQCSVAKKGLMNFVNQEVEKLRPYFPFWKGTEIYDLKMRAHNYIFYGIIEKCKGDLVTKYSSEHMQMRKLFGTAKFVVDVSEVERKNPYTNFENLANRNGWNKDYSLHRLPKSNDSARTTELIKETLQYINQTVDKDKTAIPSDWCTYCVHRGNCMESFLCGEFNASSSRTETNLKQAVKTPKVKSEPVVVEVDTNNYKEVVQPSSPVEDNAQIVKVVPVEEVHVDVNDEKPKEETPQSDDKPSAEFTAFEQLLHSIQDMVAGNSLEIQQLKQELSSRRSRREDTTRIEARLADEERKSKELLEKLAETEGKLATTEAQNITLSRTVKNQGALLEQKKALEFSEEELSEIQKYKAIIVFDTCSIMNFPNLLDGVNDGELVIVPKVVNNELENHKTNHYFDDRKFKAQRAITSIFNYKRRYPLEYADAHLDLVPEVYRAEEGEKEENDNKILAVAIRYRKYAKVPVVFITDDRSLSNKASGEDIEVWTAKDFLAPPESSFEEDTEPVFVENDPEIIAAKEQKRKELQEEFLSQKISTKNLKLETNQISFLQNNGVKTISDFMNQTEETFSRMKSKKGMPFTAKYLKIQESLRKKFENL